MVEESLSSLMMMLACHSKGHESSLFVFSDILLAQSATIHKHVSKLAPVLISGPSSFHTALYSRYDL